MYSDRFLFQLYKYLLAHLYFTLPSGSLRFGLLGYQTFRITLEPIRQWLSNEGPRAFYAMLRHKVTPDHINCTAGHAAHDKSPRG